MTFRRVITDVDVDRMIFSVHRGKITRLEHYTVAHTPLLCRCSACLHEWRIITGDLRQGKGCPKCALVKRGLAHRLKHEDFVRQVDALHRGMVAVIGRCTAATAKVLCECRQCGHRWSPIADNVRSKSGCPACNLTGFSARKMATVYCFEVKHRSGSLLYKLGITNRDPMKRYRPRDLSGMRLCQQVHLQRGEYARTVESEIKVKYAEFRFPDTDTGYSFSNTELFTIDVLSTELCDLARRTLYE